MRAAVAIIVAGVVLVEPFVAYLSGKPGLCVDWGDCEKKHGEVAMHVLFWQGKQSLGELTDDTKRSSVPHRAPAGID